MNKIKKSWIICFSVTVVLCAALGMLLGKTEATPKAEDTKSALSYVGNLEVKVETDEGSIETAGKTVTVKNAGETSQFVRLMVLPVNVAKSDSEDVLGSLAIKTATEKWKDGGDGYFYYTKPVAKGEEVDCLFKKSKGSSAANLSYTIKAEAVTTGGFEYRKAFWGSIDGKDAPTSSTLQAIDSELSDVSDKTE